MAEALDRERGGKGKEGSKKPKTNWQVCKYSSNKAKQACIKKMMSDSPGDSGFCFGHASGCLPLFRQQANEVLYRKCLDD